MAEIFYTHDNPQLLCSPDLNPLDYLCLGAMLRVRLTSDMLIPRTHSSQPLWIWWPIRRIQACSCFEAKWRLNKLFSCFSNMCNLKKNILIFFILNIFVFLYIIIYFQLPDTVNWWKYLFILKALFSFTKTTGLLNEIYIFVLILMINLFKFKASSFHLLQ